MIQRRPKGETDSWHSMALGPLYAFLLLVEIVGAVTYLAALGKIGSDVVTSILGTIVGVVGATEAHRVGGRQAVANIEAAAKIERANGGAAGGDF